MQVRSEVVCVCEGDLMIMVSLTRLLAAQSQSPGEFKHKFFSVGGVSVCVIQVSRQNQVNNCIGS